MDEIKIQKLKKHEILLTILIVFNIIFCLSIALNYESGFCTAGDTCSDVQNSIYGKIFGVPVIWIGVIGFSLLFLFFIFKKHNKKFTNKFYLATLVGALLGLYFIIIQIFVLKQICTNCLITDLTAIIIFFITYYEKKYNW